MFSILVNEKGGESKRLDFDKLEVTIGRVQGNDIILPKGNVSKRHSRIVLKDGKFIIVDLKSTNGTYVNGRKITSPLVVKNTDKVYIGDFILSIEDGAAGAETESAPPARPVAPPPSAPRPRTPSIANVPPPPPRRLEEEEPPAPADEAPAGEETVGQDDAAVDEPPPPEPRRVAPPPPSMRAATLPPPAAPRPAEPPRPSSRSDIPAIAPSRPVASTRPPAAPAPATPRPRPSATGAPAAVAPRKPTLPSVVDAGDAGRRARIVEALRTLATRLRAALGEDARRLSGDALRERAEAQANELVGELAQESGLPPGIEPDQLLRDAVSEVVGLGPLDELMADDSIQMVTVGRPDHIHVDRAGQGRSLAPRWFSSADAVTHAVTRVAERLGRIDELRAVLRHGGVFEARLPSHTLTATLGPLSPGGAQVVVRRIRSGTPRLAELAQQGALSQGMADFLELAVRSRRNIIVAGPGGSGRSTLIGALARATDGQRVVALEESSELDAGDQPWLSIAAAGPDARRAFAAALRLKPERLVVGDVRGAEALDLVASFASGLDGTIVGVTASSTQQALAHLAAAARMAPDAPGAEHINAALAEGVRLVVLLGRPEGGELRVQDVAEVSSGEGGAVLTSVFSLRGEGASERFVASGHVPAWAEGAPASMFRA